MRASPPALTLTPAFAASVFFAGCVTLPRVSECAANPAQDLLVEVNGARAREGVPPVWPNTLLIRAAQAHAQELADGKASGHVGADGSNPLERITDAGYLASAFGENTATGSSDPEPIVAAWLTSPGHRAVLLDPSLEEIGLGGVLDTDRPVWVADFGARRESSEVRCHLWQEH